MDTYEGIRTDWCMVSKGVRKNEWKTVKEYGENRGFLNVIFKNQIINCSSDIQVPSAVDWIQLLELQQLG